MPTRLLLSLATLCAALALPAAPAHAVVVERLYEATVPVPDQSEAARREALRDALGVVFVRASGRPDAATIDADAGIFLNRLSDLLFVWARLVNHRAGVPDIPWEREPEGSVGE